MDKIIEGNRLIAEFMGFVFKNDAKSLYPDGYLALPTHTDRDFPEYTMSMIKYHSSWDWLMQVVKKIKSMERDWPISTEPVLELFICSDIEIVWQKIVEFIKCYNTQNK